MTKPYLSQFHPLKSFVNYFNATVLLILCSLIPLTTVAQQKLPYNLLWKISGKGLTRPSYLFGTMHVKDKRAFGFSDSVMLAIQSCPSFALEVHPDTLMKKMFITARERDSTRSLRKWLTDAEYQKLAKRFKEKNGYPMGNLDPLRVESMMEPEKKRPDDKKSFVDAYLFGIARTLNKNVYGLENASEQFDEYFGSKSEQLKRRIADLVDEDGEKDNNKLDNREKLIDAYSKANLEHILSLLGDDELNSDIMVARNKVMFNSILSHLATAPIFSAVGVAHLPGDNGLISLLRNAGYTVTPVTANFTGIAAKYTTDVSKLKWQTFTDNEQGYSLDLPFMPMKTDLLYGLSSIIYPDIANDVFFGAYAIREGSTTRPVTDDDIIQKTINNFKANERNHILSKKPIIVNGFKGTDITMKTDAELFRIRLIISNNFLYCLYAGNDLESVNSAYANRFFDSFKSFKVAEKPASNWITFKNDTGAFSVHLPTQPKLIEKELANPAGTKTGTIKIKIYMAIDSLNMRNYLVRYNDFPIQNYLADKEKGFTAAVNEFKSRGKIVEEPRKIFKDGYEGRELKIMLAGKYNCTIQIFARGNRSVMLLAQDLQEGSTEKSTDDFFDSFTFTPYLPAKLIPYTIDDGTFKCMVFPEIKTIKDTVDTYNSFLTSASTVFLLNPVSGGSFNFEHAYVSKYYRTKNVDSLYKHMIHKFVGYSDTLLKTDSVNTNGISGREFLSKKKDSDQKKRNRIYINNGDLLYFSEFTANEELFDQNANAFLNSLTKNHDTAPINLSSSKAQLIVNDLSATDTTTAKYARGALSYYDFEKDELPYLYKALNRTYPDDTLGTGTRGKLIKTLVKVNDEKTLDELQSLYKNPGTSDILKVAILNTLPDVDKKAGYDIYLNLLTSSKALKTDENYEIFSPMRDSLDFVAANFDKIYSLLQYPEYRTNLLSVARSMVYETQKGKYTPLIKSKFQALTQYAQSDLDDFIAKKDTSVKWFSGGYNYLGLMQEITNQPITDSFTTKLIKNDENELSDAVITRIANHLPINQKLLNTLLDSIAIRYDLMQSLSKAKQLDKVPLKYKKQDEFAKLCMYQSISADEDDSTPENLVLLGKILDKGSLYYAFKYQSNYNDEKTDYIGISGPYVLGSTKLDFSIYRCYDNSIVKETNWQLQAKGLIIKLKEQNKTQLANLAK
ncbi:TraB/GumN family protein [Mucilaginibacter dorajii]|uniref:TraB/GumN family protein n=1 Tax=Mucilaginibacter dorajii TaxID=692994 RepID=A0ABP7QJK5_9SPHI|nr:TraB/GumN family protein [Mucilaginibacter dorajii]MCS3734153.1 uncharacterized protein YbaP (TraB family) [Mucilaginibacter dorajii]